MRSDDGATGQVSGCGVGGEVKRPGWHRQDERTFRAEQRRAGRTAPIDPDWGAHRCKDGSLRPYSTGLCSVCKPGEGIDLVPRMDDSILMVAAMLADAPLELLLAEVERRGYVVKKEEADKGEYG